MKKIIAIAVTLIFTITSGIIFSSFAPASDGIYSTTPLYLLHVKDYRPRPMSGYEYCVNHSMCGPYCVHNKV